MLSATGGQKVRIVGARPDAILDVEGARVGGLRESEELQVRFATRWIEGLFLIARRSRHQLQRDRLALHIFAAESIHRLDLAVEIFRIVGLQLRLPEQVRDLCGVGEFDIGRAARVDVATGLPVHRHFVCNCKTFVVDVERTDECDP